MTKRTTALFACLLVACSPDPDPASNSSADTGTEDATVTDGGGEQDDASQPEMGDEDAASEADTGSDTGSDIGDDEANMTLDITATVGDQTQEFDRAFYGVTAPEVSASGDWELHVEVYAGGDPGCPQMDSATPDVTLVMGGIKFPEVPTEQREEDGVSIALLDFTGDLYQEPSTQATGEILYFQDWSLCADCEGDDPNGYLSFDVDALLDGGNLEGHVYATHCGSLNSRPE